MATEIAPTGAKTISKPGKQDKRQAIVEAARDLFTTEGYETTTIAQVAKKAGVAVGTVYLYFKNKNELLFGVKGDWEQEFLEQIADPELRKIPHRERIRRLIETCFALSSQQSEMLQFMGVPPQMVGEMYHKDSRVVESAIRAFIEEGITAEQFRPIDCVAAAPIIFGMVHRALETCYCTEDAVAPERYINTLVDALERWLLLPDLPEEN